MCEYAVCLGQHLRIGKPDHPESFTLKERRALRIRRLSKRMRVPVNLNDQHHLKAQKIDDVVADRHLSPELQTTELAIAEPLP
jgi:hypothetical protein